MSVSISMSICPNLHWRSILESKATLNTPAKANIREVGGMGSKMNKRAQKASVNLAMYSKGM